MFLVLNVVKINGNEKHTLILFFVCVFCSKSHTCYVGMFEKKSNKYLNSIFVQTGFDIPILYYNIHPRTLNVSHHREICCKQGIKYLGIYSRHIILIYKNRTTPFSSSKRLLTLILFIRQVQRLVKNI